MAKHKVTFLPADVTVEVDTEVLPYGRHGRPGSLLDVALPHGVEIAHACGGEGFCGTCHVLVEEGEDNLSEADDDEMDTIERVPTTKPNSRLACLAVVQGDVTVRVPE